MGKSWAFRLCGLIFIAAIPWLVSTPAKANAEAGDVVIRLDDGGYTAADIASWWNYFREPGMEVPASADPYIDWLLLAREANSMQLYELESYRRKLETFLKVRAFLLLKQEEIDSRIDVREEDIRAVYEQEYLPRYQGTFFFFRDPEAARAAMVSVCGHDRDAGVPDTSSLAKKPMLLRPARVSAQVRAMLQTLSPGQCSPLEAEEGHAGFFLLETIDGFDPEDFASQHAAIQRKAYKAREQSLTEALLAKLRSKFHAALDQEAIAALDPGDDPGGIGESVLAAGDVITLSASQVGQALAGDPLYARADREKRREMFLAAATNIFNQELLFAEARSRNYQERSPLREEYAFYRNHRLIKELERKLFQELPAVSQQEIIQYYDDNKKSEFRVPAVVEYRAAATDRDTAAKLHIACDLQGRDFRQTVEKFTARLPEEKKLPFDHLPPPVKTALEGLSPGEVSKPVKDGDGFFVLQLVTTHPSRTLPLEECRAAIEEQLTNLRRNQAVQETTARLRRLSRIHVDTDKWRDIRLTLKKAE
ncbi:MAG: peptidyl-prolyl cis-trans isomerase [Thermodesulfobacteriota bacterium]